MSPYKILIPVSVLTLLSAGLVFGVSQELKTRVRVFTASQSAYVEWAVPEGRVGPASTNWDTLYYLKVKETGGGNTLFTMSTLASTSVSGNDLTPITLTGVDSGVYDFFIKGHQSLTRKLANVTLAGSPVRLNFSQADNSASLGTVRLLAGDISGSTSSPATMGDDVVNAVDLGILLNGLDGDDATGNDVRANLNQDPVVNSVDMSLMLGNLDAEGDE